MSLLESAMTECVLYDKRRVPDGEGGYVVDFAENAHFMAAIVFDSSMEARAAEKSGVTSVYTVTLDKSVPIEYHDVFKRLSDGKIFRVTSDGGDKKTPPSASFQVQQVTAEEWSIT